MSRFKGINKLMKNHNLRNKDSFSRQVKKLITFTSDKITKEHNLCSSRRKFSLNMRQHGSIIEAICKDLDK